MEYIGSVMGNLFSIVFIVFAISALGYLVGSIKIKGISLGTAGVLLVALLYGILASYYPTFTVGNMQIVLFDSDIKSKFNVISSMGTALFVTAVGLIAGPKFFRLFNKKSVAYIFMSFLIIGLGALTAVVFLLVDKNLSPSMAAGLLAGALTSTPGLSAAKETLGADTGMVTAGYGVAYLFGVFGVVLLVQLVPKLGRIDIAAEREKFVSANKIENISIAKKTKKIDPDNFFSFMLTTVLGCILGALRIPGSAFTLGVSAGTLIAGLVVGHFGHIGPISCQISKNTLNFMRELGLMLFLIGAGVPSGVNFVSNLKAKYFLYGIAMTLVPMIIGYVVAKRIFKMSVFNSLGAITGGMTSTPALGTLISVAGTDEVTTAYAATYPCALVAVVLLTKFVIIFF